MSRKQIAAANWKMNLTLQQGEELLDNIISKPHHLNDNQLVIFAIPAPYLSMAQNKIADKKGVYVAAQNCYSKKSGAFTGEISVEMLTSLGIQFVVLGHSERREYFNESNAFLAEKINICLENNIQPIFCCGEPLSIREADTQNEYVAKQLKESLYHLSAEQLAKVVIAYEPIWAIGTGNTPSNNEINNVCQWLKQEHRCAKVLYGGSVSSSNIAELAKTTVDGLLVGGASLKPEEVFEIIKYF